MPHPLPRALLALALSSCALPALAQPVSVPGMPGTVAGADGIGKQVQPTYLVGGSTTTTSSTPSYTVLPAASAVSGPLTLTQSGSYVWDTRGTYAGALETLKQAGADGSLVTVASKSSPGATCVVLTTPQGSTTPNTQDQLSGATGTPSLTSTLTYAPQGCQGSGSSTVNVASLPGSTGADYSANSPAIPVVGSAFASGGASCPSYVLLKTIPPSATRANVDVEDQSGGQVCVVRDDGTAAAGSAPVNASVVVLGGGAAAGAQGGSYTSTTFKGRLQIYAPSTSAQVAAFTE